MRRRPKGTVLCMDDGNEASRAVAPSTVDQLLAKRLPFFVLWFERWKRDCRLRTLARPIQGQKPTRQESKSSADLHAQKGGQA